MGKKPAPDSERRARVEQMRLEQQRKERRNRFLIFGCAALVLALVVGGVAWAVVDANNSKVIENLNAQEDLPRNHITEPVAASTLPPLGGDHSQIVQNCGAYSSPVSDENVLHSMEHGAVWITYQPDLSADAISELDSYAKGQTHVLVSPYPGQPTPVVATAWGKQVQLTGPDDPNLKKFIKQYQNGPQAPEPGALCSGGTGTPEG